MSVLSKHNLTPLRDFYLKFQVKIARNELSTKEINDLRSILTTNYDRPESDQTLFDPVIEMITNHFKFSGLDWACAGVRWGTFFINLCTNVISAVTTTKTWVKVLNSTCIIAILAAVILEILTSVKHFKMADNTHKTLESALKRIVSTALFEERIPDLPDDMALESLFDEGPPLPDTISSTPPPPHSSSSTASSRTSVSLLSDSLEEVRLFDINSSGSIQTLTSSDEESDGFNQITTTAQIHSPVLLAPQTPGLPPCADPTVRQEATHWYTIVKKCMAILLVIVAFGVTKGDLHAMHAWITMDKFRDVIVKQYNSASDVIEWLANDVCGFEFTEKTEALKILSRQIQEAEDFLATSKEEFAEKPTLVLSLSEHINRTTKLIQTAGSITDISIKNSVDLLKARQTQLVGEIDDILKTVQMKSVRQEPVPIMIYGEHGAGKSTYITQVLIPALAKKLNIDSSTYTVKFTGSDKYWPEYANQKFALYDEAFDRAADVADPMVESFNTVCSKIPYNMQGAFNKYQMCNFHFVFVATNKMQSPRLTNMLSPEASAAFWHRLMPPICFEIKQAYKSPTGVRGGHQFRSDWSHCQLFEASCTINQANGTYTINQKNPITHDQLINRLVADYQKREREYATARMATAKQQCEDTSSFVVNIHGPTGTGKSYTARHMAHTISQFINKPVYEHNNKVGIVNDGIHIANDVLPYNESDYNRLYNEAQGLLFNTTNPNSEGNMYETNWSWKLSKVRNFLLDCFNTLPGSYLIPLAYSEHSVDLTEFNEAGTARRIGVPGRHSTKYGPVYVSDAEAVCFRQKKKGFLTDVVTGKDYDIPAATNLVWKKYCEYIDSHQKIYFHDGIAPPTRPDIDIYFESIELCRSTLQSRIAVMGALARPNNRRYIKVHDPRACFEGKVVDESYFLIPNADVEVKPTITTMITNLRHLGIMATVRVKIGNDTYFARGNRVTTSRAETAPRLVTTNTHADIYLGEEVILSIPIDEAVRGFHAGFSGYTCTQLEYLLFFREQIESTTMGVKTICSLKQGEILKQKTIRVLEGKEKLSSMMAHHPAFPYLVSLCVLMSSAAVIGAVALITRYCCKPEEPKEVNIYPDIIGMCHLDCDKCLAARNHSDTDARQETFDDDDTERAFQDHVKARNLKPHQVTMLRNSRKAHGRPLGQAIGDLEYNALIQFDSTDFSLQSLENLKPPLESHLMKKIHKNMVVCVAGANNTTVHGILLKENIVLTVSHLGHINPRVACDYGTGVKVYDAECIVDIPDRDIQIWRILDKTFPPAQSILQYFPTDDTPHAAQAQLVVVSTPNVNVPCTLVPDPVHKYENWEWTKGGYVANFHSSRGCVTFPGYCGFVYISNKYDTIYGIHVGSKSNGVLGLMTLVPQDIIKEALTTPVVQESYPKEPDAVTDKETMLEILSINDEEWGLLPCSYYDQWNLEAFSRHAIPDTPAQIYVGQVPFNNPFPRKSKFQRTDFPEFDEFPNDNAPSPLKVTEEMDLVKDVMGRPDIALTQVAKFGGELARADRTILLKAVSMVKEHLVSVCGSDMPGGKFPMATLEEAINGFGIRHPLHGYVEHLNMHSGTGFYWKHKWSTSLKLGFFIQEGDKYVLRNTPAATHLQQCLNLAEEFMSQGVPPLFVNEDCIKSELLPADKVKIGKSRLFSVADTVEVLLERKYFLYALAILSKYHNELPIKLGANPLKDFNVWSRIMRRYGATMIEGDFSRFDKNVMYDFILAAISICLDDPDLAVCFAQIISKSFHHIYDFIYHLLGKGQNSGSGITTLLNSLVLMILIAYAYIKIYHKRTGKYPKANVFVKVFCLVYGDDFNYILDSSLPPAEVAAIFKEVGLEFNYEIKPINEAKFLSRQFHFVDGTIYAALKPSSFIRHLYWTSNNIPEQRAAELSLMLDEAACHTKALFQQVLNCIFQGLRATNDVLTLSLIDWRCFTTRRAVLRGVIFTDAGFTREPISLGDAFSTFPSVEEFNTYVRNRYTKADKILRTQEKEPVFHTDNPSILPSITVHKYLSNVQQESFRPTVTIKYRSSNNVQQESFRPTISIKYTSSNTRKEMADQMNSAAAPAKKEQTTAPSGVRASVVPAAAIAHSSLQEGPSNVSQIPVGPTPPVQITGAEDATPPQVIGNTLQAPSMLEAGGILSNVVTAAYGNWYLVGQGTVAVDAAHNTKVFELPYGLSSLAGAAKIWVSMHERYTGPIRYLIESVGNAALAGTIMVGWTPNLQTLKTVEALMRIGKWINMPMNVTTTGLFIIPDVRKNDYYRDVNDLALHGILGLIHVPLSNPYGTTGATVTYNMYVMLDPEFLASFWREIPAEVATSYPTLRVADVLEPGSRFIIDGFETGKCYHGEMFYPATTINGIRWGDTSPRGHGYWAHPANTSTDPDTPGAYLFIIGNNSPPADFLPVQETHTSANPLVIKNTTGRLGGTDDGNTAGTFITSGSDELSFTSWSAYWDNTAYGFYFYVEPTIMTDVASENAGCITTPAEDTVEPNLTVTYWAYPFTNALPADYLRVTASKYTFPLNGALVETAQGRASVPPTLTSQKLVTALSTFAGSNTLEFDLLSEFGGAAVLTCRYDSANGIYCRMNLERTRAYYFQNAVADDMLISNIRVVDNGTIMRQSPTVFFAPRFSSLVSTVAVMQKKKVRTSIQQRMDDLFITSGASSSRPSITTRLTNPFARQEAAEAALVMMSGIGAAASSMASAGGSILTRKKDREFAKEMMEAQQNFAREMWNKQTAVNQLDKFVGMGYDWHKQQGMWAHQSELQKAMFQHQNVHDFGMWGLNTLSSGLSQAATMHHQTGMQQRSLEAQASMQQASFAHDEAMQQQRIDTRMAALGVTNPAANVQTPGTSQSTQTTSGQTPGASASTQTMTSTQGAGTQTVPPSTGSVGIQTVSPGRSTSLAHATVGYASRPQPKAYAPASHSRPPGTPFAM